MYLSHHGIEGQQWGVRNGPPYPLQKPNKQAILNELYKEDRFKNNDFVIKKNTNIYRVGKENEKEEGSTYVTYLPEDHDKYLSETSEIVAHEYRFKSVSDLKIADGKSQIDTFMDMYGDKKIKHLIGTENRFDEPSDLKRKDFKNVQKDPESFKKVYRQFFDSMMDRKQINKDYISELQKKGYSGMLDYTDYDRNFTARPIIIFDRYKSLKLEDVKQSFKDEDLDNRITKADDKVFEYYMKGSDLFKKNFKKKYGRTPDIQEEIDATDEIHNNARKLYTDYIKKKYNIK